MTMPALLSAALMLLLLLPGTLTEDSKPVPVSVVVEDTVDGAVTLTYATEVASKGTLLDALKTLMATNSKFTFTYIDDPNYGPSLEYVNGVAGNEDDQTFWEVLVKKSDGQIIRPDGGIAYYIPSANDQIHLGFTKW
ncbi:gastric intrinsic factor-like [Stegastes partitus]|uniref:Gastric intrinsic factor-like n=1 Tax=Stegastes partitus TaxID=144197 RepID=A0A9Y4KDI8_9TELE|nr:PREDICTED: gastric intrinsic factor-like [Stegastes partitus]